MAFAKGKSGNPSGRPKKLLPDGRSLSDLCKVHTQLAVTVLSDILIDGEAPLAARISAAQALLDRGWGKPSQAVEVSGPGGSAIQHAVEMSDDALLAIATGRA